MQVILSLGSNVEQCHSLMSDAIALIGERLAGMRCSECYLTPAEPSAHHPAANGDRPYLNAVVSGQWHGSYDGLHQFTKEVERRCGRCPGDDVAMDIDIVVADGRVLRPRDFIARYFVIGYTALSSQSTLNGIPDSVSR